MEYLFVFSCISCILFNSCIAANTKRIKRWEVDDYGCRTPDYGVGDCIKVDRCKVFDKAPSRIEKYICGFEGNSNKVCCPHKSPAWYNTDYSQHKNIGLLPTKECGMANPGDRIINGNITELFEFPWAAVLKYNTVFNPFACGASLISNRYILTAAHCIKNQNQLVGVRLGEYNFTTDIDCIVGYQNEETCALKHQDFEISADDAIVHPEYDGIKLKNDIALIRLPTEAVLNSDSVLPICLPITEAQRTRSFENFTVIGWGATETGFASKVLLKALVPTVENAVCASRYATKTEVSDKQLCAGGKNEQDACTGDSGSPLSNDYEYEDKTIRTLQYGLVSFGPGKLCGRETYPVVYTKVSEYIGWILDNLKP